MDVGIRELKQHLSEYLDRVEKGETIRVTDRGAPKALITPLHDVGQLEKGVADGWVRPATRGGFSPVRRHTGARPSRDVIAEDRDE